MVPALEGPECHGPSEAGGARAGRAPTRPGLRGHFGRGIPGDRVERGRSGAAGAATPVGSALPAAYLGQKREPSAKGQTGTPPARDPGTPSLADGRASPALPGDHRLRARADGPLPRRRAGLATPVVESRPLSPPPRGANPSARVLRPPTPVARHAHPRRLQRTAALPAVCESVQCARGPRSQESSAGRGPGAAPLTAPPARPARCSRRARWLRPLPAPWGAPRHATPTPRGAPRPVAQPHSTPPHPARRPPRVTETQVGASPASSRCKDLSLFAPCPLALAEHFAEFGSTADCRCKVCDRMRHSGPREIKKCKETWRSRRPQ